MRGRKGIFMCMCQGQPLFSKIAMGQTLPPSGQSGSRLTQGEISEGEYTLARNLKTWFLRPASTAC